MSDSKVRKIIYFLFIFVAISIYLYDNFKSSSAYHYYGNNIYVHFIDVGQADSILITCKDESMLIDAGNNDDGDMLVNYFKNMGINSFKYVVGTHAHEDHIGGMDDIIDNFDIGTFYMPDVITTTKTFEDVLDSLEKKNYYFDTPKTDSEFNVCDASFKVIYVGDNEDDLNSTSIVLKMKHGNNTFLFTGDMTSEVESKVINKDISADVLKVAHHGSNTSSSKAFLDKVRPKYAIISCGLNNKYNHPHDVILKRLKNIDASIYRTDEVGTIVMESDGNVLKVTSEK